MGTIPKTLIATADPASIVKDAIPYDENDTGNNSFDASHTLWDTTVYCYPLKVSSNMAVELAGGIAPTSFGFRMDAEGETTGQNISLKITNDMFQAGKLVGMALTVDFQMEVDTITYHRSGWHVVHSYKELHNFNTAYRFDMLAVLIDIVEFAASHALPLPFIDVLIDLIPDLGINGYFDEKNGITSKNGKITLTPQMLGDIDLTELLTSVLADTFTLFFPELWWLAAIAEFLEKIRTFVTPRLTFGLILGFGSPIDISMTEIILDDVHYGNLNFTESEVTGTTSDTPPQPQFTSLTASFVAKPRDSLLVGVSAELTWLKIFNLPARKVWDISELTGTGSYDDITITFDLGNTVGATDTKNKIFSAVYDVKTQSGVQ